jgi:uncharacterized protein (DUF2267 family)
MRYEHFVSSVRARVAGGLDQRRASAAIDATLTTLAERLTPECMHRLDAQLPRRLQRDGHDVAAGQAFGPSGFLSRVATREDVSRSEAYEHVRAVMAVLAEAVSGHVLAAARTELGEDYEELLGAPAADHWPEAHRHQPHP